MVQNVLFILSHREIQINAKKSQLGDTAHHFTNQSHKGWSTSETFQDYLHKISNHFHNELLHLLLDLHSSHRGDEVKEVAESLNIDLH